MSRTKTTPRIHSLANKRNGTLKHLQRAKLMISFLLNLPYTCAGVAAALVSVPSAIQWHSTPPAYICTVRSFWWMRYGFLSRARALTIGHIVLLGPTSRASDIQHELTHVAQYSRYPVVFPILYYVELIRKGYTHNKYEREAQEAAS